MPNPLHPSFSMDSSDSDPLSEKSSYSESETDSIVGTLDSSPEPHPSSDSPYLDGNGIFICSAPDTDEFATPPEESRDGGEAPAVDTDSQGVSTTPIMAEVVSGGLVRVSQVSNDDLDSFRVERKREIPVEEPSPSKKIRVSVDSEVIVNAPGIEIGVTENMEVDAEELGSGTEVTEQVVHADAVGDSKNSEEDRVNNGGTSNLQEEHEDLSRQGKRVLPPSWGIGEDGKLASDTEETASDSHVDIVLEVLGLLADEARLKRGNNGATGDFFETAKKFGMVFPEPDWWHDDDDE